MDQVAQDAAENKIWVPGGTSGPVWTSVDQWTSGASGTSGAVWSKWQLQVEGSFGRLTTQTMCGLNVSAEGNQWRTELRVKVNVTAKSWP